MSNGKGIRHRPHWMKPYLKAEMFCLKLKLKDTGLKLD